jgi:hypothetical protein
MKNPDIAKHAHFMHKWCKTHNLLLLAEKWRKTRNEAMKGAPS